MNDYTQHWNALFIQSSHIQYHNTTKSFLVYSHYNKTLEHLQLCRKTHPVFQHHGQFHDQPFYERAAVCSCIWSFCDKHCTWFPVHSLKRTAGENSVMLMFLLKLIAHCSEAILSFQLEKRFSRRTCLGEHDAPFLQHNERKYKGIDREGYLAEKSLTWWCL